MIKVKWPLAAVLFTCVVLLSSAAAFADSGSEPELALSDIYPLNSDVVYERLADGSRAVHDVNDVYLLLYDDIRPALRGSNSSSVYSLPRIAYDTRRGLFGSGTMETVSAWDLLYRLAPTNNLGTNQFPLVYSPSGSGLTYTQSELQAMTWNKTSDILTSTQAITNSNSQINTTLQNLNSKISSYQWIATNSLYFGTRLELFGNNLISPTASTSFVSGFTFSNLTQPQLIRIEFPTFKSGSGDINVEDFKIDSIIFGYNGNFANVNTPSDYFFQQTNNSLYLYLFDFNMMQDPNASYWFTISYPIAYSFDPSSPVSICYLNFNSDDFQQIKQAFYTAQLGSSVSKLADYFVSSEKQAAENASQAVIDDTLDGFTGNGSAAAKVSDTSAMKNMSGSVQSGLSTGASAGNATSVFTDNRFWAWFTQQNSDYINSAYPAPTFTPSRSGSDEIVDYVSGNQQELQDLLNGSSW